MCTYVKALTDTTHYFYSVVGHILQLLPSMEHPTTTNAYAPVFIDNHADDDVYVRNTLYCLQQLYNRDTLTRPSAVAFFSVHRASGCHTYMHIRITYYGVHCCAAIIAVMYASGYMRDRSDAYVHQAINTVRSMPDRICATIIYCCTTVVTYRKATAVVVAVVLLVVLLYTIYICCTSDCLFSHATSNYQNTSIIDNNYH